MSDKKRKSTHNQGIVKQTNNGSNTFCIRTNYCTDTRCIYNHKRRLIFKNNIFQESFLLQIDYTIYAGGWKLIYFSQCILDEYEQKIENPDLNLYLIQR